MIGDKIEQLAGFVSIDKEEWNLYGENWTRCTGTCDCCGKPVPKILESTQEEQLIDLSVGILNNGWLLIDESTLYRCLN